MANELTYSRIKHLIPEIWEATLWFIQYQFLASSTIINFTDRRGMTPRNVSGYVEDTDVQEALGELEDLTPDLLERELLARLTPQEAGKQYIIPDRRAETDDVDIVADAARALAYAMGKKVEKNIFGLYSGLTGGKINAAGNTLTWADIYAARGALEAAGVPAPYNCVLHTWQWLDLATAANIAGSSLQPVLQIRDQIQRQYYVTTLNDITFYVTGLLDIDNSDDVTGAMYARDAMAFDLRRAFRLEPQRDASLRSWELNSTMIYARGLWMPDHGIQIVSDATSPVSAVSQSTTIVVGGVVDDSSVSTGTHVNYTFFITNTGTTVAREIAGTFTIDSDFTYVSDSPSQGSYSSSSKIWSAGELAPGQTAVLNLEYVAAGNGGDVVMIGSAVPAEAGTPSVTVSVTVA